VEGIHDIADIAGGDILERVIGVPAADAGKLENVRFLVLRSKTLGGVPLSAVVRPGMFPIRCPRKWGLPSSIQSRRRTSRRALSRWATGLVPREASASSSVE
jgi:hypothetical protein